ncbi:hypothetical protein ACP4OV_030452 [Aristida adscensionis]
MSFLVTKLSPPALVAPSAPTPAGELPLSSTGKSRRFLPFTSFHVFHRPIAEPAETIRRALSGALVHYYPVAGRIVAGGDHQEDARLACTGEGVAFAAAAASCTLEDAGLLHPPPAIRLADLALRYGGRCRPADPLLMVQVTVFACGGYVVATAWNHGVADAVGMAQLLRAVGELARGLPSPSVAPVRHDARLRDVWPLFAALRRSPDDIKPAAGGFARCEFIVPGSFIGRVKAAFRGNDAGGRPCTAFEAVAAGVWQCRARAIGAGAAGADAPAPHVFTANVRELVGSGEGYYGNCISSRVVTATGGAVAHGAAVDLVKLIRDAKERMRDAFTGAGEPPLLDEELVGALRGYGALYVSTWAGIGMDGVDFGGGRPARVVPHMERTTVPSCLPCPPCSGKKGEDGGANVVAFCVTEDDVDEPGSGDQRLVWIVPRSWPPRQGS